MARRRAVYVYESDITKNIHTLPGRPDANIDEIIEHSMILFVQGVKSHKVYKEVGVSSSASLDEHFRDMCGMPYRQMCHQLKDYIRIRLDHYHEKKEGMIRVPWL